MTDPKPSTNDILAKIRAKAASASPSEAAATSEPPVSVESTATPPANSISAETTAVGSPASAPKSTADIMAAARAKAKPPAAPTGTAAILAAAKKPAGAAAATPAVGAAPKSPADILAAIRAKAGAVPAATPSEGKAAAAAAKPAAKVDAAKAAGKSAAEMIREARAKAEGAPVAPEKIALPSKPLPGKSPAAKKGADVPRRSVLGAFVAAVCSWVFVAWSSIIAASTVGLLGTARFMMPNVLVEPPTKFKVGPPNDYAPGTVSTKWQAQFNIWVVNAEVDGVQVIYALSTVCTHLGCTPNWLEGEQKFKCPCHGSGFYKSGVNFEGPAPRPLERFAIRVAEDGMLEVDKSVKFQKELGQWSNSSSFVGVT
ncbi:MAG TPA: ubiquinol-cytochrome c reductase iron-sulfur subunit [Planctomycetaceae bacterium]|nr:ubiquinol-cytochrome c reductase iron-sulfur subunit [Planctomycetaceae bacterium]